MKTVPVDIKDALDVGDLLYSMIRLRKFNQHGENLAHGIINRISEVIPAEYHANPNQLEFEFVSTL